MPLRLQNLLRENLTRLGYPKDEMEKKLSNYFAQARTDQLRMALVKTLIGISLEFTHFLFILQATLFRREAHDAVARFTLLHEHAQLHCLRRESPFKASYTADDKRAWLVEYKQKIVEGYQATKGKPVVRNGWKTVGKQ